MTCARKAWQQHCLLWRKQLGKAPIRYTTSDGSVKRPQVYSTGSLTLDIATECGGLPAGRFVAIYGGESSGKTTLCLQAIAQAQRHGATCAFIDAEHALEPSYAQRIGVNLDEMPVIAPDTGEQAFQIIETLILSGSVNIIVVDSAAQVGGHVHHLRGAFSSSNHDRVRRQMPDPIGGTAQHIGHLHQPDSLALRWY